MFTFHHMGKAEMESVTIVLKDLTRETTSKHNYEEKGG